MSDIAAPHACIVGWPVAHSRSPVIHGFWLKEHDLPGSYDPVPVPPDAIDAFLAGFAAGPYVGGNVTIPHKEVAFRAVAGLDPAAEALGAVNTLWLDEGRLLGANTDMHGFLASLDEAAPDWAAAGRPAVVLGAGGAARAVVYGLLRRGLEPVHVVNRSAERAEALAKRFGPGVWPASWRDLPALLARARVLVNTTSLGMAGQPPLEIDLRPLPDDAVVNDIVYTPLETPLLAAARARGLVAVDGLGMLLHQAVPGFERWFGVRPSVSPALRAAVLADLDRR